MSKYRLQGKCTIFQYCHVRYPASTRLRVLTRCQGRNNCSGHEITKRVDEIVAADSPNDAIGNESLTQYEYGEHSSHPYHGPPIQDGDGLEPTWIGRPTVSEVSE